MYRALRFVITWNLTLLFVWGSIRLLEFRKSGLQDMRRDIASVSKFVGATKSDSFTLTKSRTVSSSSTKSH